MDNRCKGEKAETVNDARKTAASELESLRLLVQGQNPHRTRLDRCLEEFAHTTPSLESALTLFATEDQAVAIQHRWETHRERLQLPIGARPSSEAHDLREEAGKQRGEGEQGAGVQHPAVETILAQEDLSIHYQLVETAEECAAAIAQLESGYGHFAVDTERTLASTYYERVCLLQVSRIGAGNFLFDLLSLDDYSELAEFLRNEAWIVQSFGNDLLPLRAVGFEPTQLLDTAKSAQLLKHHKTGLLSLSEHYLGLQLNKNHSRERWSRRPLPLSWMEYAALDTAVLPALWMCIEEQLQESKKLEIAHECFEAVRNTQPKQISSKLWKRLEGAEMLKTSRSQNIAQELCVTREEIARKVNRRTRYILSDSDIVRIALSSRGSNASELRKHRSLQRGYGKREFARWAQAVARGSKRAQQKREQTAGGVPAVKNWEVEDPARFQLHSRLQRQLARTAEELDIPVTLVCGTKQLQHFIWKLPFETANEHDIYEQLLAEGLLRWQANMLAADFAHTIRNYLANSDDPDATTAAV